MPKFIKVGVDGMVQQAMLSRVAQDGFSEVIGPQMSLQELAECMVVEGALIPRPLSPQPYVDGSQIIVPPCPEGTVITVFDINGLEIMGEIITVTDDQDEVIELPDPGKYVIEVQAPVPFLITKLEVHV
jgi:hypothetical protein